MRQPSTSDEIAAVTRDFVRSLSPHRLQRVEARVASADGMLVLSAVESALAATCSTWPAQELVWLSGAPSAGVHRLTLSAYGSRHELLAEAAHEFVR